MLTSPMMCLLFRAPLMLLVGANSSSEPRVQQSKYPLAKAQARELPEQRRSGRYASESKRGQGEGCQSWENLRGQTRQEAARIESEPSICGAGEDGWFAYRIAARRLRAAICQALRRRRAV